ncbi:MAG: sodium-dependent transporter [Planctomycetota bacterium]
MSKSTEQWASRLGVILAVAGSAVGLGNFLRFPGQAAANGGGAFMIPYFCALLFLGIPIGWAEWTMGRYGGARGFHSAPAILGVVGGRVARYFGIIGVLIPLCVYFYYVFVESWALGYCIQFLKGGIGVDTAAPLDEQARVSGEFYEQFTGRTGDGDLFHGTHSVLWFWLITVVLNTFFVFRGLSKGIEAFCKLAMPAMAICAVIVLVRVLTLGTPDADAPERNVVNGLGFMWNPNFKALGSSQTWLAAAGQIFFSLSVGFGVIINYASYLRRKDDVVLSGLTASSTNELFEVGFGGMITLPAAFIFLGATAAIEAAGRGTFSLGFTTLPVVFAHMPMGNLVGAVWFFMLFLAAITSSLSMLQPTKAFFQEALGVDNTRATVIVTVLSLIGCGFVLYFSGGGAAMGTIDDWIGTFLIVVLAAVQVICFAWVFGIDRGMDEAMRGAQMRIPGFMRFIYLFVAPAYLLFIIGRFCIYDLPGWWSDAMGSTGRMMAMALVGAVVLLLLICTAIGEKRWRTQGLDIDGREPVPEED